MTEKVVTVTSAEVITFITTFQESTKREIADLHVANNNLRKENAELKERLENLATVAQGNAMLEARRAAYNNSIGNPVNQSVTESNQAVQCAKPSDEKTKPTTVDAAILQKDSQTDEKGKFFWQVEVLDCVSNRLVAHYFETLTQCEQFKGKMAEIEKILPFNGSSPTYQLREPTKKYFSK